MPNDTLWNMEIQKLTLHNDHNEAQHLDFVMTWSIALFELWSESFPHESTGKRSTSDFFSIMRGRSREVNALSALQSRQTALCIQIANKRDQEAEIQSIKLNQKAFQSLSIKRFWRFLSIIDKT